MAEAAADYFTGKGWGVETKEDGMSALELLQRKSPRYFYHGAGIGRRQAELLLPGSRRLRDEALLPSCTVCKGHGADRKDTGRILYVGDREPESGCQKP